MLTWTVEDANRAWRFILDQILDNGDRLGDVIQPWQEAAFAAVLGLPGNWSYAGRDMVEVCGPVGCGKDQIIAICAGVLTAVYPGEVRGIKQSTDRDKSQDVVTSARGFKIRNPKHWKGVRVMRDAIRAVCAYCDRHQCGGCKTGERCPKCPRKGVCDDRCPTGTVQRFIECESLDGPSLSGAIYDIVFCNEVQAWPPPDGAEVYFALLSRQSKRKGRFVCFTNAPHTKKGEWRRDRYETAREPDSQDWYYIEPKLEKGECPWITEEDIAKARRNLPTARFKRLFLCEVSEGLEELITAEELARCTFPELAPADAPDKPGVRFMGLDAGVRRDHYCMAVVRLTPDRAVVLERMDTFVPPKGGSVDLEEAKALALDYGTRWRCKAALDPWQARDVHQALEKAGVESEIIDPTAKNLTDMAHAIMSLTRDGRLRLYPNAGFLQIDEHTSTSLGQQLLEVEVKEQERGGIRMVSQRTKAGHGDQASALALALLLAWRAGHTPEVWGSAPDEDDERARRASGLHRMRALVARHTTRFLGIPSERHTEEVA